MDFALLYRASSVSQSQLLAKSKMDESKPAGVPPRRAAYRHCRSLSQPIKEERGGSDGTPVRRAVEFAADDGKAATQTTPVDLNAAQKIVRVPSEEAGASSSDDSIFMAVRWMAACRSPQVLKPEARPPVING